VTVDQRTKVRAEAQAATTAPALYTCTVRHVRQGPVSNDFEYRTWLWFVDLDDPPRLPRILRPLGQLRARDHAGDPRASLRANVDAFLAEQGVDLRGGRVTMLTAARSLGHVFNPLTVYWCHDAAGDLVRVIAEVHNTYGGRHRYLLDPDEAGRAETAKEFYVSPFYPVDGTYRLSLPEPGERLALTIRFDPPGGAPPFVAVLRGGRRPLTTRGLLRQAARQPSPTLLTAARIRRQGVRLYLRGLPVIPRSRANPRTETRRKAEAHR
jgi:hypothetical protein